MLGQHQVEHDEIEVLLGEARERVAAVGDRDHVVAVALQRERQQGLDRLLVVDEQDAGRSGRAPLPHPARPCSSMGTVLDHRVYRAAFLPALVALFVLAFSLTDRPKPQDHPAGAAAPSTGRARSARRCAQRNSVRARPRSRDRRPGPPTTPALADRVAAVVRRDRLRGTDIERRAFDADTIDGEGRWRRSSATPRGPLEPHDRRRRPPRRRRGPGDGRALRDGRRCSSSSRLLADRDLAKTDRARLRLRRQRGLRGRARGAGERPRPGRRGASCSATSRRQELRRPFVVPWPDRRPARCHSPWSAPRRSALRRGAGHGPRPRPRHRAADPPRRSR